MFTYKFIGCDVRTLKREVRRWHERVNVRGERIALPTTEPLDEAAWMKDRIAQAKQDGAGRPAETWLSTAA